MEFCSPQIKSSRTNLTGKNRLSKGKTEFEQIINHESFSNKLEKALSEKKNGKIAPQSARQYDNPNTSLTNLPISSSSMPNSPPLSNPPSSRSYHGLKKNSSFSENVNNINNKIKSSSLTKYIYESCIQPQLTCEQIGLDLITVICESLNLKSCYILGGYEDFNLFLSILSSIGVFSKVGSSPTLFNDESPPDGDNLLSIHTVSKKNSSSSSSPVENSPKKENLSRIENSPKNKLLISKLRKIQLIIKINDTKIIGGEMISSEDEIDLFLMDPSCEDYSEWRNLLKKYVSSVKLYIPIEKFPIAMKSDFDWPIFAINTVKRLNKIPNHLGYLQLYSDSQADEAILTVKKLYPNLLKELISSSNVSKYFKDHKKKTGTIILDGLIDLEKSRKKTKEHIRRYANDSKRSFNKYKLRIISLMESSVLPFDSSSSNITKNLDKIDLSEIFLRHLGIFLLMGTDCVMKSNGVYSISVSQNDDRTFTIRTPFFYQSDFFKKVDHNLNVNVKCVFSYTPSNWKSSSPSSSRSSNTWINSIYEIKYNHDSITGKLEVLQQFVKHTLLRITDDPIILFNEGTSQFLLLCYVLAKLKNMFDVYKK
jgi:hypothetical protein